jgi:hypothetical protein
VTITADVTVSDLTGKTEGMARTARSWTVMTWNVRGAGQPDIAAVAIEIESPDVVVIQEIRKAQGAD